MNTTPAFESEGENPVETAAMKLIATRLQSGTGLEVGLLKPGLLQECVDKRLRSARLAGVSGLQEYARRLASQPEECEQLGSELRPEMPLVLGDARLFSGVLPLLGGWAAEPRPRQVWIPACGNGDEVMAFALMSLKAELTEVTVIGTDVDAHALDRARKGVVELQTLKEMPKALQAWVSPGAQPRFSAEVMQRCQFVRQGLLQPPPLPGFDLISCRGLLTTLETTAQRQLLESFHAVLGSQGRLIVAKNEHGLMPGDLFVEVRAAAGEWLSLFRRVERRRGDAAARPSATLPAQVQRDRRASYEAAFQMSAEPMALLDAQGVILNVNAAWRDQVSRHRNPADKIELLSLVEGRDPLLHLNDLLGQAPGSEAEQRVRFRLLRGSHEVILRFRRSEAGAVVALDLGGVQTSLRQELDQHRKRVGFIGNLLREGVITVDPTGRIVELSGTAERMTAWREDEALGQPINRVLHITDDAGNAVDWLAVGPLSAGSGSLRYDSVSLINREGRALSVMVSANSFEWSAIDGAPGAVFIVADITVNQLLAEELNYRSRHDALTGLLSREEFERRLSSLIAEAHGEHSEHAFAYFDLDQFKLINEVLGHFAGDELLRQLCDHLRFLLQPGDVFARLGGDEFGLLISRGDLKEAEQAVRDVLETVRALRFEWEDAQYGVTASIGLIWITDQTASAAVALTEAEAACVVAKDAGRDRLYIAEDKDKILRRRNEMGMVARIHRALDLDLFELHFENVVSCRNPKEVAYRELLVRMKDDEQPGQLISPGLFIPAAERYSMMAAIDRWVINKAFQGIARQPADGVLYAINVSGLSLNDEHFLTYVLEGLDRHGIAPQQVCFEITETAAIAQLKEARGFIERLVSVGCCFALDDFGVGMSSFSYLKNLPVAFLKIDGSFVRSMMQSQVDRGMVEAINWIGHEMNLKTIAEHVESPEVLAALAGMGVDYAQGWAISRARPFDALILPS